MTSLPSSVTTSDTSWPTTEQSQSHEAYQQYYQSNYYQSTNQVPVAATTSTVSDPNIGYNQDYNKAWDEYYKAYYGQSYTATAPTAGYNYDQYDYSNWAAAPPQHQCDQYSQAPASSALYTASFKPNSTYQQPPLSYQNPNNGYQNAESNADKNLSDEVRFDSRADNNRSTNQRLPNRRGNFNARPQYNDNRPQYNDNRPQSNNNRPQSNNYDNTTVHNSRGSALHKGRSGHNTSDNANNDSDEEFMYNQRKRAMIGYNDEPIKAVPLMDIIVRPSGQTTIILRRQTLIDQWQQSIQELAGSDSPIDNYWIALKSALKVSIRSRLLASFVRTADNIVHCELQLDDIFLTQSRGSNESEAVEEAAKLVWQLLETRHVYVHTATRGWGPEKVPVFCVSHSASGPVVVPPVAKGVIIHEPFLASPKVITAPPSKSGIIPTPVRSASNLAPIRNLIVTTPIKSVITPETIKTATQGIPIKVEGGPIVTPYNPPTVVVVPTSDIATRHNYNDDDIFVVVFVDLSANGKDQSITVLNNTARFNDIRIEYKHEKPADAPHISQCLITINGEQFHKGEARDYSIAKREAADKVVSDLKLSCPQISLSFDRAIELVKDNLVRGGELSVEDAINGLLRSFVASDFDGIYKFTHYFSNDERDLAVKVSSNLNLLSKQDGKGVLFVFKHYPVAEMKKRIIKHGYCAQYKLIDSSSNGATV